MGVLIKWEIVMEIHTILLLFSKYLHCILMRIMKTFWNYAESVFQLFAIGKIDMNDIELLAKCLVYFVDLSDH